MMSKVLRKYVKVDENLLACETNSTIVPSSTCEPYLTFVPSSVPILVSYSDDYNEDENPPSPAHLLLFFRFILRLKE